MNRVWESREGPARSVSTSASRLTWTGTCLSIIILGLLVAPWPTPSSNLLGNTFDPVLITQDSRGFLGSPGRINVVPREASLIALPHSQPTIHLMTAEIPFTASFTATIGKRDGALVFPLQIKVWNPRAEVAAEAWYSPDGTIMGGVRIANQWDQLRRLATYTIGENDSWHVVRNDQRVILEVARQTAPVRFEVDRSRYPDLFAPETVSLTVYATAPAEGSSSAVLRDPVFTAPQRTVYGTTIDSGLFRTAVGLTVLCGLLWIGVWMRRNWRRPSVNKRDLTIAFLLASASIFLGVLAARAPGHPFDVRSLLVWTHIAREHGLAAIGRDALVATESTAHGGQPYVAATFPYPPLLTYPVWLVGKLAPDGGVERTFKILATIAVAVGGGMLFALLRRVGVSRALTAVAMGAYVLNPAVLFDSAVWGQTDPFLAWFLLVSATGIVLDSAPLVWVGAFLAALTKQTGVAFAPVMIVIALARIGPRQMLKALPIAIIISFLALAPALFAGIHPSAIYRPIVAKILGWGTIRNMEAANALVAQNGFTLWSAVASLEEPRASSGLAFPDFVPSRFGVSYFMLSRITFSVFALLLAILFVRRRDVTPGVIFLTLAAYELGVAVLLTRILPRYYFFGLMFVAASLPWMSKRIGTATLAVVTGTMLVSMWGTLALVGSWHPGLLSAFEPQRSWLNAATASAISSTAGLLTGGLLNAGALVALLVSPLRKSR